MKRFVLMIMMAEFLFYAPSPLLAEEVPEKIRRALPDLRISEARPIPIEGPLYEVTTSQGLFYVDPQGRFLFMGDLYDLASRKNLTEERRLTQNRIPFDSLPLEQAIHYRTGKYNIALFVDPDCPFCQKLHPELHDLDASIYIFLFPLTDLHPQAYRTSVNIWCSKDRNWALDAAMMKEPVPIKECPHPVQENLQLGARIGIRATPTIILGDGRRIEGYRPVSELEKLLSEKPSLPNKETK